MTELELLGRDITTSWQAIRGNRDELARCDLTLGQREGLNRNIAWHLEQLDWMLPRRDELSENLKVNCA